MSGCFFMCKSIVILNFSPRSNGNCDQIANRIAKFHAKDTVLTYHVTAEHIKCCSGCNYECLKPDATCPLKTEYHTSMMDSILNCDIAYYVIPNFCGQPVAGFYAFNERSVGYFNGDRGLMQRFMSVKKRFIMVSNTENDAFKAAAKQQTSGQIDMLYMKTGKYKKVSIAGDMLESPEARADLQSFLENENI